MASDTDPIVPLVPALTKDQARECDWVRCSRDDVGYVDRIEPSSTLDDVKTRFGPGRWKFKAVTEGGKYLGNATEVIAGDPLPVSKTLKKDRERDDLDRFFDSSYPWGPGLDAPSGKDPTDKIISYMEVRAGNEAAEHRRALERQESDRKAEKERQEVEHKARLDEIRQKAEADEKKIEAEMRKFQMQMDSDRDRRKEEMGVERERQREEAKIERERREEERKREREWMDQRLREMENQRHAEMERLDKTQKEERERQREHNASLTKLQNDFTAALLTANKRDDSADKMLSAIEFGINVGDKQSVTASDPFTPLATTLAALAQEGIRERREKRMDTMKKSWTRDGRRPLPGRSTAAAPAGGDGGKAASPPQRPPRPEPRPAPEPTAEPAQQGGPMTPIVQMAIVTAVKKFSPETLFAMVFDLYDEHNVSDQTFELVKSLPDYEVVKRFLVWVNSRELLPHKDKLLAVAHLVKAELSDNEREQPTGSTEDQELQEALSKPAAVVEIETPVASAPQAAAPATPAA